MTGTAISAEELADFIRGFERTAYRQEYQVQPLLFEQDAFRQYLAGSPLEPAAWPVWQDWLDRVQSMTAAGKLISRVILLDAQPTPYQQWRLWSAPWHGRAGEDIRFLPVSEAGALGNWWLFDDSRVVLQRFTDDGRLDEFRLITGPEVVSYCTWRDYAMRHAMTAETIAA